jgi:hypothetical protein
MGARIKTNAVMTGLVPVIHVFKLPDKLGLAGTEPRGWPGRARHDGEGRSNGRARPSEADLSP